MDNTPSARTTTTTSIYNYSVISMDVCLAETTLLVVALYKRKKQNETSAMVVVLDKLKSNQAKTVCQQQSSLEEEQKVNIETKRHYNASSLRFYCVLF
jgi:hypothetical protein